MKKYEEMSNEEQKKLIMEIKRFDEEFDDGDGVYAIPRPTGEPKVKVRALADYCKKKSDELGREVKPMDLSPEELELFLVYWSINEDGIFENIKAFKAKEYLPFRFNKHS